MGHSVAITSCPVCTGTLTQIHLGDELMLRSCSACDLRWWQRGEHMTKRVEALAKTVADLQRKGQFAEACPLTEEILKLRRRVQGEDHWETINARRFSSPKTPRSS